MTNTLIKPRTLRPGDRVATISLSHGWASVYPRAYQDGKRQLQEVFGVEAVESRYALASNVWLAAHPEARAADLMATIKDPSIQGIISIIGGDDSIRMLPFLDYSVIRDNPKIFLGYSDSTITHFAFLKAGVTSFYGPSLMAGFDENGGLLPFMTESVRQVLFSPTPSGISPNHDGWSVAPWDWGGRNETRSAGHFNLARVGSGCRALGSIAADYWADAWKRWTGCAALRSGPSFRCGTTASCSWRLQRISPRQQR